MNKLTFVMCFLAFAVFAVSAGGKPEPKAPGQTDFCPPGTKEVSKYEAPERGYSLEKGRDLGVSGNTRGCHWKAKGVCYIVVKSATNYDVRDVRGKFDFSQDAAGNKHDISHVRFCGCEDGAAVPEPEPQPEPEPEPGILEKVEDKVVEVVEKVKELVVGKETPEEKVEEEAKEEVKKEEKKEEEKKELKKEEEAEIKEADTLLKKDEVKEAKQAVKKEEEDKKELEKEEVEEAKEAKTLIKKADDDKKELKKEEAEEVKEAKKELEPKKETVLAKIEEAVGVKDKPAPKPAPCTNALKSRAVVDGPCVCNNKPDVIPEGQEWDDEKCGIMTDNVDIVIDKRPNTKNAPILIERKPCKNKCNTCVKVPALKAQLKELLEEVKTLTVEAEKKRQENIAEKEAEKKRQGFLSSFLSRSDDNQEASSGNNSMKIGAIVGSVLGAALIAAVVVAFSVVRKRRAASVASADSTTAPLLA